MIYIILPVHNRKNITEKFIKCLISQTFKEFRLILIDDGSTDGTSDMVLSYLRDTVIIKGCGNLWWAGSLQKGYEWIITNAKDDDVCVLINDDVEFENGFLRIGYEYIIRNQKTLLLAQCYSKQTGKLLDAGVYADLKKLKFRPANSKEEINCLSTRGLFLKVRDFKEIGGFFPKLLPHYLSDYEFTIRAHKKGFKLTSDERLKIFVDEKTTGLHKINSSNIKEYYLQFFSKKHASNPIYWITFTLLTVPFPYKIYHTVRFFFIMIRAIIKPLILKFKRYNKQ